MQTNVFFCVCDNSSLMLRPNNGLRWFENFVAKNALFSGLHSYVIARLPFCSVSSNAIIKHDEKRTENVVFTIKHRTPSNICLLCVWVFCFILLLFSIPSLCSLWSVFILCSLFFLLSPSPHSVLYLIFWFSRFFLFPSNLTFRIVFCFTCFFSSPLCKRN